MPRLRDPIPDELREFIALCRAGKLFAVRDWIAAGKLFRTPPGNFATWPLRAAVDTGFHSVVEVLLQAGVDQAEKDYSLSQAISARRLDLVELLVQYGANTQPIGFDEVICSSHPAIIRWFVERDMDMESGWPIARAFEDRHREFLGIYMGLRDIVRSARMQAAMALRVHAREGNLKWVSLLLWAGADPRLQVPDLQSKSPEKLLGTALEEAVINGHEEIVRKIGIDHSRDDPSSLLAQCFLCASPSIVRMLIDAGADFNKGDGEMNPMQALVTAFESSIDGSFPTSGPEPVLKSIEIAARAGGRWRPSDPYRFRCLRTALARSTSYSWIDWLTRLIDCGAIERPVFAKLMQNPRMKQLLLPGLTGVTRLRELAGLKKAGGRLARSRWNAPTKL